MTIQWKNITLFEVLIVIQVISQFLLCLTAADISSQQDAPSLLVAETEKIFEPISSSIINIEDLYDSQMNSISQNLQIQTFMTIKHPLLNIAYVASLSGGLFVIDLEQKSILQSLRMNCKKIFMRLSTLYASKGKDGFSLLDIDSGGRLNSMCDASIGSSVDSIYVDATRKYIYIGSEGYIYLVRNNGSGYTPSDFEVILHVGIYSGETNYIYSARDEKYLMVANLSNGVSILNISNKEKPYLVSQKLPKWQVVDLQTVSSGSIVYAIEEWYGLFVGDFSQLYVNESQFKANDSVWVNHIDFQTISRAIAVSQDEKLLFVGLRSIGVQIFDISLPEYKINPQLVQKVQIDGLANHIFLFNSDTSFLYTNGCCVAIFNQVEANYNTEIPNIFNTQISRSFQQWSENTWPWDYLYSSSSQYLYLASAYEGLEIFELSTDVFSAPNKIFAANVYPSASTDTVALIEEKNLLIQGCSEKGVIFWDISNIKSIKKVAEFNHPLANSDSDGIIYNKKLNCIAIANGYQGSYLLDISDLQNLKIISEINIIDYDLQVTAETVNMTQDAMYLIISLRYYGVLIFNMKYLKSPNMVSNFHTYGGEKCILSYDENYIFVSDSFKGLTIINFKDREAAFIEYNLNLGCQVQYGFQSLINPNILYLSLIENGQLAMIDLSDMTQPFVIAKVQFGQERSIALRESPNGQFIAYLTSNGIRLQSIKLSVKIHTQIRKINKVPYSLTKFTYENINPQDSIQVGQNIELFFSSIYFDSDIKLKQIFYYRDFEINEMQSWMQFFPSKNVIQMLVDKTALNNSNGCNIILLQILKKFDETSFIEPTRQLTQALSSDIFNKLKKIGILQNENFLNLNNFFVDTDFYIDLDNPSQYQNMDDVQDYIKQVILQSIYYQPIKFNVISSLNLNINYNTDSSLKPIETLSSTVKIIIKILEKNTSTLSLSDQNKNASYFVEGQKGHAAQINLSQDFKQITIEGSTSDVNDVLLDGLQVVLHNDQSIISLQITLIDTINYELTKTYTANQLTFLKNIQSQDIINTLKEQFQQQISESLTVQKDYTFIFSATTFERQLPQKDNVDFTAFIKHKEDVYENIANLDWIDFDSNKREFKWCGGLSQLQNRYIIVVNATTSSYWVLDEFEIYFERIPVEIIIIICLTSFTVALILFLLYCYRSSIQHIRYFDKYTYSSEPVFVNKSFSKIIILVPNYLSEFHKLWDRFIKNEKKENNKFNFKKYLNQQKEIDVALLIEKLKQTYESNKHFYSKLKQQEFVMANIRLQYLVKGAIAYYMIKEDRATYEVYLQLKQIAKKKGYSKDWYKLYSKIIYPEKGTEKQPIHTSEESNSHSNFDSYHISQMDQNFPIIFVDGNKILITLEEANSTNCQKDETFNHYLLFENIKAEAFGYVTKSVKRQESSQGETIHISPSNIKKIVAFRKNDDESRYVCFPKFRTKFLLNFKEIQNLKNSNLPEWLKCDISQQTITFSGKPNASDVGDILIRIYDNNNYILNQFFINIRKMRKQTYFNNGDAENNLYSQQYPMMSNQNCYPVSKLSQQYQLLNPSRILSSQGSVIGGNNNLYVQQSPNQLMNYSPHPSSTQITQTHSAGHKRILRNHRNNTQKYTIKQYQQFLIGDNNTLRFKSENQIKDSSLLENHKKNSDDIANQQRSPQSLRQQEDSLIQDRNVNTTIQNNLTGGNNNCSNQLQSYGQENQPDIRVFREETIFSKSSIQQVWNKDSNNDNQLSSQPFYKNQQVQVEDVIQEEQYASQKDHKSVSSFMYTRHNKPKLSLQLNESNSYSVQKNSNDYSELEKSQSILSFDVTFYFYVSILILIISFIKQKINVNSPKLTQFKPKSIRTLNIQKLHSMENLN